MRARKSISTAGLLRADSKNCAVRSVGDADCADIPRQHETASNGASTFFMKSMRTPKTRHFDSANMPRTRVPSGASSNHFDPMKDFYEKWIICTQGSLHLKVCNVGEQIACMNHGNE